MAQQRAKKRAKIVEKPQFESLLAYVRTSAHALRDEVALRLNFYAGLRAGEITKLQWYKNILDAQGKVRDTVHITGDVGKRGMERQIPIDAEMKKVLQRLRAARPEDVYVFYALHNYNPPKIFVLDAKGNKKMDKATGKPIKIVDPDYNVGQVTPSAAVQWFRRLYLTNGFVGCSSHSGRRTFITTRARTANLHGCSLKDVQILAGHSRMETTGDYIEPSNSQRALVSAWE